MKSFTLVELLVVIGIITVLIALQLPTFGAARRQARSLNCLSNLRQLATAFQIYINGNKGRCFGISYPKRGPLELEDVLLKQRPKGVQSPILFCDETYEPPLKVRGAGDEHYFYPGDTFRPWGWPDTKVFQENKSSPFRGSSYGMNGWLLHAKGIGYEPLPGSEYKEYIQLPASESHRVPLFADGTDAYGFPRSTDLPPLSLNPHRHADGNWLGGVGRVFCIPRHGRAINVVFLDGHARTVPLAELWRLKWNNVWVPTTVTLPAK